MSRAMPGWKRAIGAGLAAVGLAAAADDGGAVDAADAARAIALQREGLRATVAAMDAAPELFPPEPSRTLRLPTPGQRERILATWGSFGDRVLTLEALARRHADFADPEDPRRLERFALHRAAFLAAYRFAMDFVERVERDPALERLLDEAHPEAGLPTGAYSRLKLRYLHVARASEFASLEVLRRAWDAEALEPLAAGAAEDAARIWERGRGSGPAMTAANALRVVQQAAGAAWLPVQERVARWAGDTRVRRRGDALVSPEQIAALAERLEPGDVLLERREWYLTNAGIPGYWPHAALYVGTPEEREAFFAGPEVEAWLEGRGARSLETLLREANPEAYARGLRDEDGHPRRVLEAIADGVRFTSLEHSAAADAVAALRPRLSRAERAVALLRAFAYAGRPYDYEFDFLTDAALVCSELVYKAYRPNSESRGLDLPLEPMAGRLMMTPNQIARLWAEERARDDRQLDFVWMLDGDEGARAARPADADTFAGSWRRPKWHIVVAR